MIFFLFIEPMPLKRRTRLPHRRFAMFINAVSAGDQKVTDPQATVSAEQLSGDGLLLRKGKKGFCRVLLAE